MGRDCVSIFIMLGGRNGQIRKRGGTIGSEGGLANDYIKERGDSESGFRAA